MVLKTSLSDTESKLGPLAVSTSHFSFSSSVARARRKGGRASSLTTLPVPFV